VKGGYSGRGVTLYANTKYKQCVEMDKWGTLECSPPLHKKSFRSVKKSGGNPPLRPTPSLTQLAGGAKPHPHLPKLHTCTRAQHARTHTPSNRNPLLTTTPSLTPPTTNLGKVGVEFLASASLHFSEVHSLCGVAKKHQPCEGLRVMWVEREGKGGV